VMQRVRTGQRRTFVTYLIVALAAIIAAYAGYRWITGGKVQTSQDWLTFYDGSGTFIEDLAERRKEENVGKAARFELTWFRYWDNGIKMLGANKDGAMKSLAKAADEYRLLAELCKDDPVFEPQALLGRAVAEESLAVEDRAHLDKAKDYYKALTDMEKYEKTAEAKYARQRLEILNDPAKKAALASTYIELQDRKMLDIPAPAPLQRGGIFP
jgi:hypothetical protein